MSETTERPSRSISHEVWAHEFVRKACAEPGFALDEDAIGEWFADMMSAAYMQGLNDGAML